METISTIINYGKKAKKAYDKTKKIVNTGINAYESETAKNIINFLPKSDETARPQYKGEKHAILILKNNRPGFANYLGSGTHIIKRLEFEDPGRTYVDNIAKLNDINIALSTYDTKKLKQIQDIRDADALMLSQLKKASDKHLDKKINIIGAEKLIKSKSYLEDFGLLDKDNSKFAIDKNKYTKKEEQLLIDEKNKINL